MTKGYIGIDIGKKGAIVYKTVDGSIQAYKMPMIKNELDYAFLHDILKIMVSAHKHSYKKPPHLVFEKLGVIFGSSKATAFSMGHQSGAVEMLAIALELPYTKIPAKQWQKEMFIGVDEIVNSKNKRDTKAMALVAAKRLFPDSDITTAAKPHDGMIDALLMAEYAARKRF
ncbi:MAG: hypothetical protein EBU90_05540 [Proteobacteria bacterium]|jgi:hypothetical protein|nr:hypothetical protein [Pseudomonadota bacterium]NBP13646.1 hypothetical protein [bacterium]